MKITQVSYRELRQNPDHRFENKCIEASSVVGDAEDAELVLANLKKWVDAQFEDVGVPSRLKDEAMKKLNDVIRSAEEAKRELTA